MKTGGLSDEAIRKKYKAFFAEANTVKRPFYYDFYSVPQVEGIVKNPNVDFLDIDMSQYAPAITFAGELAHHYPHYW